MKSKIYHIPIFVPHKGCPHDCVFCNQKRITGQLTEVTPEMADAIIQKHLKTISQANSIDRKVEIAFFGGSFTAIDIEKQKALLKAAYPYVQSGQVNGIRCSTRPDCISLPILQNLKNYSMRMIELGVQSANKEVLELSERGHDFGCVKKAAALIQENGIGLGLQMMTGLPGDSPEKSIETAKQIAALRPDCVRIYPTLVLEGTKLMEQYKCGLYIPQTVKEAVALVAKIVPIFEDKEIPIIRIGLQTTEEINAHSVVGPYHPAFTELVYGRLYQERIEKYVRTHELSDCKIELSVAPKSLSKVIGHKKENLLYFQKSYGVRLLVHTNRNDESEKILIKALPNQTKYDII